MLTRIPYANHLLTVHALLKNVEDYSKGGGNDERASWGEKGQYEVSRPPKSHPSEKRATTGSLHLKAAMLGMGLSASCLPHTLTDSLASTSNSPPTAAQPAPALAPHRQLPRRCPSCRKNLPTAAPYPRPRASHRRRPARLSDADDIHHNKAVRCCDCAPIGNAQAARLGASGVRGGA